MSEQAKEKRIVESKRKYTVRKKAVSGKKKRVFFFFFIQVVFLSVVISILYSEIILSLYSGFSLQRERVST